jgi:hypothetical protein
MNKKKIRKTTQIIIVSITIFLMIIPTQILQTKALKYYNGGILNKGFNSYDSNGNLRYWNGAGSKRSSPRLEGSHSFYTSGATDQTYYLTQTLTASRLSQIAGENYGETITFSFWFKGRYEWSKYDGGYGYYEHARAEIRYKYFNGYRSYTRTAVGDWVYPKNSRFHQASVSVNLPDGVYYLQVRIVGVDGRIGGSFRTYIDLSSLDVTKGPYTASNSYGKMGYGFAVKGVVNDGSSDMDGIASLTAALGVVPSSGYFVMSTKITITLDPVKFHDDFWPWNDYYYTSQKGKIDVTSLSQGNNLNYDNNPQELEDRMNEGIRIVGVFIDTALGACATTGWGTAALVGASLLGVNGESILQFFIDTDLNDPIADAYNNPRDYTAHEKWQYKTCEPHIPPDSNPSKYFVSKASGIVNFKWMMDTDSASSFKITIKYEAQIGNDYVSHSCYGLRLYEVTTISKTLTQVIYI